MNPSTKLNFVIILLIVLVILKLLGHAQENFTNCSLIKNNYSQCYDSGDCTIMLDLDGNSFCTNKT